MGLYEVTVVSTIIYLVEAEDEDSAYEEYHNNGHSLSIIKEEECTENIENMYQ